MNHVDEPVRSTQVTRHELERLAGTLGVTVYLPPAVGGWARITSPTGNRFHAWVPAAGGAR